MRGWLQSELSVLTGLATATLAERLALYPADLVAEGSPMGADEALPPIAGRFVVAGDAVLFEPRFPFVAGTSYTFLVRQAGRGAAAPEPHTLTIARPCAVSEPAAEVLAIYPSAAEVPLNLLRVYIYFSEPMSEGWASRALTVHRASDGAPLTDVFLASKTELWDRDHRRLTMLLDPGRIKRGLVPNAEAGYPLTEGVPIVLTIGTEMRDHRGAALREPAERRYAVSPAIRRRVDPHIWRLQAPCAATRDRLMVRFDRPLDHGMLLHSLAVRDGSGSRVSGEIAIGPGEESLAFRPNVRWEHGEYALFADARLEDTAGNSVARVFDRDLELAQDEPVQASYVVVPFVCHGTSEAR